MRVFDVIVKMHLLVTHFAAH